MTSSNPVKGKGTEGAGLNLKNEAGARAVKSPRPAPLPFGGGPALGTFLEVNYLRARINFCSAAICLLIDAINATIDCRTAAFVTSPEVTE